MISIDSGSLVLLDPATAAERSLPAPRLGAPLAKMTRVWRVETHSDGVGADLPGVQVGPDVLPRYLGVGIVQKTALVIFYLSESTDMISHLVRYHHNRARKLCSRHNWEASIVN